MREIKISADDLIESLLDYSEQNQVCLLDSGGVEHLESHLLIAGINPREVLEINDENAERTLEIFDEKISPANAACIFTISYDFGLKLEKIKSRVKEYDSFSEPDIFLAVFDNLIIHDYRTGKTVLTGDEKQFDELEKILKNGAKTKKSSQKSNEPEVEVFSNFTRRQYLQTIRKIQVHIRRGDTYQTNLTQQLRADLPEKLTVQEIFRRLRTSHPAAFSAFIKRKNDCVLSISPERFFKVQSSEFKVQSSIKASPIKGTRPRGTTRDEDEKLKNDLLESEKDRAENVMIVDLLRNDLGRICEFGSVEVEKICELETHPTLFHLVSTIRGELLENIKFSEILKAVFPCGSITGAPKIRTMRIIDDLETTNRGLSMGAIGYAVRGSKFELLNSIDLNVAIRTMVVRNRKAVFNVGGGIVIDSIAENEYEETLTKAKALLQAINGKLKI